MQARIGIPTITELFERLNELGEANEIEAKKSETELGKSALETISAFSNEPGLGGGYLLFGVSEEEASHCFHMHGILDPNRLEQAISTACANSFNRTIRPQIWSETSGGKVLVAAFIPEAAPAEKPVFIQSKGMNHGTFRRIGSTDQRCTEDDLRTLFQLASISPFEETPVADSTMDDLDDEVIASYRRALIEANPATELQDASTEELVQSVGGAKRLNGRLIPTVAGVLLFGKRLSLRRLYPALRIDYIRVPGTEWVPDADQRYESIEIRDPLLVAFRRIYAAVIDDIPKSFSLEPGTPERKDRLALPESAVREVLVNALTHRDYRMPSALQVIRYQDRIEVRNPGYSLANEEQLGEPGSFPRNPRVSDIFREMRLAENKGTGIAAVRRAMDKAGLTPPLFDSDRGRNQFIATLWLHNLFGEEDMAWLQTLRSTKLSDAQAQALVVARRMGFVSNALLRAVSGLDTLAASVQLRQLRDQNFLELRGKGAATHYVLGPMAKSFAESIGARRPLTREPCPDTRELGPDTREFNQNTRELPQDLQDIIENLGPKANKNKLRPIIERLCQIRPFDAAELAHILRRSDSEWLVRNHLSAMVEAGTLKRMYPDANHPKQAYISSQTRLPVGDEQMGQQL